MTKNEMTLMSKALVDEVEPIVRTVRRPKQGVG